jgi:hypothetical protein
MGWSLANGSFQLVAESTGRRSWRRNLPTPDRYYPCRWAIFPGDHYWSALPTVLVLRCLHQCTQEPNFSEMSNILPLMLYMDGPRLPVQFRSRYSAGCLSMQCCPRHEEGSVNAPRVVYPSSSQVAAARRLSHRLRAIVWL